MAVVLLMQLPYLTTYRRSNQSLPLLAPPQPSAAASQSPCPHSCLSTAPARQRRCLLPFLLPPAPRRTSTTLRCCRTKPKSTPPRKAAHASSPSPADRHRWPRRSSPSLQRVSSSQVNCVTTCKGFCTTAVVYQDAAPTVPTATAAACRPCAVAPHLSPPAPHPSPTCRPARCVCPTRPDPSAARPAAAAAAPAAAPGGRGAASCRRRRPWPGAGRGKGKAVAEHKLLTQRKDDMLEGRLPCRNW